MIMHVDTHNVYDIFHNTYYCTDLENINCLLCLPEQMIYLIITLSTCAIIYNHIIILVIFYYKSYNIIADTNNTILILQSRMHTIIFNKFSPSHINYSSVNALKWHSRSMSPMYYYVFRYTEERLNYTINYIHYIYVHCSTNRHYYTIYNKQYAQKKICRDDICIFLK